MKKKLITLWMIASWCSIHPFGFSSISLLNQLFGFHIHPAVAAGDLREVKRFLDCGIDVNYKDNDGNTPLHCAAQNGQKEIFSFLMSRGANLLAQNDEGDTILHCTYSNPDMLESVMFIAQSYGVLEQLKSLKNEDGTTMKDLVMQDLQVCGDGSTEDIAKVDALLKSFSLFEDFAATVRRQFAEKNNISSIPFYIRECEMGL